jgi:hypothetical protein
VGRLTDDFLAAGLVLFAIWFGAEALKDLEGVELHKAVEKCGKCGWKNTGVFLSDAEYARMNLLFTGLTVAALIFGFLIGRWSA